METKDKIKLIFSIAICEVVGFIGMFFTNMKDGWYASLIKPSFTPPGWIFFPVWIALYALIGLALYFILGEFSSTQAVFIFFVQLAINASWPIVFFRMHSLIFSVFVLSALWIAIVFTLHRFYEVSKKATLLLIPYFVWVSFALILNVSIWWMNAKLWS